MFLWGLCGDWRPWGAWGQVDARSEGGREDALADFALPNALKKPLDTACETPGVERWSPLASQDEALTKSGEPPGRLLYPSHMDFWFFGCVIRRVQRGGKPRLSN